MSILATQETVRPEPGLARGVFAAPPFFFYALVAVAALGVLLWFGRSRLAALFRTKSP